MKHAGCLQVGEKFPVATPISHGLPHNSGVKINTSQQHNLLRALIAIKRDFAQSQMDRNLTYLHDITLQFVVIFHLIQLIDYFALAYASDELLFRWMGVIVNGKLYENEGQIIHTRTHKHTPTQPAGLHCQEDICLGKPKGDLVCILHWKSNQDSNDGLCQEAIFGL